jgi:truncated hemoglobin YjbI
VFDSAKIASIVRHFYRAVLGDPHLEPFFHGVDMEAQIGKMTLAMIALANGDDVDSSALARAHSGSVARGLTVSLFDRVWSHLQSSLEATGLSIDIVEFLNAKIEGLRNPFLGAGSWSLQMASAYPNAVQKRALRSKRSCGIERVRTCSQKEARGIVTERPRRVCVSVRVAQRARSRRHAPIAPTLC